MMMQMPGAQVGSGYGQALGERIMGAGLSLGSAGISGFGTAVGMAGMVGGIGSALGIGGAGMAGLGMLGAAPVALPLAAGVAAAGFGANQMMTGFQQRQGVNRVLRNRFGGMMGVGQGRGGRGFSTQEMGGISTMLREMGTEDMFTNMEELTRVMDRTAQMGTYQGVRSARQFKQRFQQTVDALKEIAQTMNTTLEGATEFMQGSRQMGFFSGRDISRNLMSTRMGAAATGMSVGQLQQIGQMGSQMGMGMGWRGRTGAQAAQNIATNIGTALRSGGISQEQMFEATGGLQGAEAVQALTGRMMQVNNRFLSRGAGRVLTAAMWDPESGGVNREMMERIQRGEISFQEARRIGRRNIARTGGNRSEFFAQEERIRGQAMEQGGFDLTMGMIEGHFRGRGRGGRDVGLDSPIVQRWLRRRMGMSQSEVEAFVQMRREMPRTMQERRSAMRQEAQNMVATRRRQGQGLQGLRRRWSQWWEREVENPIRQAADDMTTNISSTIEEMMNEFEGRIQTSISSQTQSMVQQWARTGQRPSGMLSQAELTQFTAEARRTGGAVGAEGGFMADLGRAMGVRGPGMAQQLRQAQAYKHGLPANASTEERAEFLQKMQRDLSVTASDLGVGSSEMKRLGSIALDEVYGSMSAAQRSEWMNNRSNKDKAMRMARDRIRQLKKNDDLAKYFSKAKNWYQGYALLTELEGAAGLGALGIDPGAMPGGGGGDLLRMGLVGAKKMQQANLEKIIELSGKKGQGEVGWGEIAARTGIGLLTGGASETVSAIGDWLTGGNVMASIFGREGGEGGRLNLDATKRLLKNNELREDLRLAREGNKAARQRLTKASLALEGGGTADTGYGEAMRDRDELRTLLDMAVKGTAEQKAGIDAYIKGQTAQEQMILASNVKKSASDISRYTARHTAALREGMGEDAYNRFQKIVEMQEAGDIQGAVQAEREFFQKYGGSKEGNYLLAHLRKGGVGEGLQEGLATMSDYTRIFRGESEKSKAKMLMEMTLGRAGIRGQRDLRQLLGRGFMQRVTAGKVGPEELAKQLVGKMSEEQLQGLADQGISQEDFMQKLVADIKMGKGGVTMEELQRRMAGQATDQAWGARIGGAEKEQVDNAAQSLKELRTMNQYMQALVKGNDAAQSAYQQIVGAIEKSGVGEKEKGE